MSKKNNKKNNSNQQQYGQQQYGQQQAFPQAGFGQQSQPNTEAILSQGRQAAQESSHYINALKLTGQTQLALQMEQLSSTIWGLVTTADTLQHQLDQQSSWQGASQQRQQGQSSPQASQQSNPQFAGSSF